MQNKKVIIIGDDIRQATGVANILRPISLYLSKRYDIVQLAAGLEPDKEEDISDTIQKITENDNAYFKIYGADGYGSIDRLNEIIEKETCDCIFLMTDPHRFGWILGEDRASIKSPIFYYHVWDNKPYPKFLKSYYENCETISCISKLTEECVKNVVPNHNSVFYTPHGVDTSMYFPQQAELISKNRKAFLGKDYKFVLFFNGTNITRKEITSTIISFEKFYNKLTKSEKKDVVLLMHTNPDASRGVNLNKILDDLYPELPVLISNEVVSEKVLNNMYNLSHCTINIASNEGFGLCTLESVATKTPVIINKTGGLVDQINKNWTYTVKPSCSILKGTQKTPYIFSDHTNPNDVAKQIMNAYKSKEVRMGDYMKFLESKNFTTDTMCRSISNQVDQTISNWSTSKS